LGRSYIEPYFNKKENIAGFILARRKMDDENKNYKKTRLKM